MSGGLFGLGGDDSVDPDTIRQTRQLVRQLAEDLDGQRFDYETRQDVANAVEDLLYLGGDVTTARLDFVPAEQNPTVDELVAAVRTLATAISEDYLDETADPETFSELQNVATGTSEYLTDVDRFPYEFQEFEVEYEDNKALRSIGERTDLSDEQASTEVYAGPYGREQLERHRNNPDDPLWLGTGTRNGLDASIKQKYLFRHAAVFGPTGYGKSTLLVNAFQQLVNAGYGGCFIDPKGDDSKKLMERIPDHRTDDVIWIEPGSSREHVSGFNFINLGLEPDHPLYDTALTNLVDDLAIMVGADEWPRMKRVARNLVRAMNMYNRDHPDTPDLNLIDLYYILASEASRQEFAARARAAGLDFVHEYTEMIADMDDSDLEPLLGRFQPLVEDPLARRMIGFRESDVNIPQAVEDDKIIVVRMSDESDRLKADLGMAIVRRLWATIRSRAELSEFNRDPYFLFVDEFDEVAKRDGSITTMLSESRSYRLSLFFCCQYPGQLPDDITEAMFVNADSILSFNPGSKKQAREVAPQLDLDKQVLLNESNYHIWMRINVSDTMEKSEAFRVYTHPPYPPLRSRDIANDLVDASLERHGRERKTTTERKEELLFYEGQGQLETGFGEKVALAEDRDAVEMYKDDLYAAVRADERGEDPDSAVDDGPGQADSPPESDRAVDADDSDVQALLDNDLDTILESIFAARVRAGKDPGHPVPLEAVEQEAEYRLGDTGYLSKFANAIERLPDQYVNRTRIDGTMHIGLTPPGRTDAVEQDTGESGSGGGAAHRHVLANVFVTFTKLGYVTWLPTQEGDEDPDGVAETPISPMEQADSLDEAKELEDRLRREAPGVYHLSGSRDLAIEAETSTPTKPCQPIKNFRKAVDNGNLCVFACKDGTAKKGRFDYWAHLIEQKFYTTHREGRQHVIERDTWTLASDVDAHGNRTFYNERFNYKLDGDVTAVRPHGNNRAHVTWREDGDEIVVEDTEVGEFARFDSLDAVRDGDRSAVTYYEYDQQEDGYYVYHDGDREFYPTRDELSANYTTFSAPYIPDHDFETPLDELGRDDYLTIIYPDDDNPDYDHPQVYDEGELVPLREYVDVDLESFQAGDLADTDTDADTDADADTDTDADADADDVDEHTQPDDGHEDTQSDESDAPDDHSEPDSSPDPTPDTEPDPAPAPDPDSATASAADGNTAARADTDTTDPQQEPITVTRPLDDPDLPDDVQAVVDELPADDSVEIALRRGTQDKNPEPVDLREYGVDRHIVLEPTAPDPHDQSFTDDDYPDTSQEPEPEPQTDPQPDPEPASEDGTTDSEWLPNDAKTRKVAIAGYTEGKDGQWVVQKRRNMADHYRFEDSTPPDATDDDPDPDSDQDTDDDVHDFGFYDDSTDEA